MYPEDKNRILMVPEAISLAHVARPLAIAQNLRGMGYEVIFACGEKYQDFLKKDGFEVYTIWTMDADEVYARLRRMERMYNEKIIRKYVDSELVCINKIRPHLIVGDFRNTLKFSSEITKIPYIPIVNAYWTRYYSLRLKPPDSFIVSRILGKNIANFLSLLFEPPVKRYLFYYHGLPFRRFAKKEWLAPVRDFLSITHSEALNLLADIPEYAPTKNLPSNFKYIGPILWEPDMPAPKWLSNLDFRKPTIYFTLGTTGSADLFEEAVNSFKDKDYQVIMATGGLWKISNTPENFYITDFAPSLKVMQKCKVVICHGGNGTIYQALSRGLPIIGIPTFHDQEFNMDRVVDLGVGIRINRNKSMPQQLLKAVEEILSISGYSKNAKHFQEIIVQYDAAGLGAKLIDEFMRQSG